LAASSPAHLRYTKQKKGILDYDRPVRLLALYDFGSLRFPKSVEKNFMSNCYIKG